MPHNSELSHQQSNRWLWVVLGLVFFITALNPAFVVQPAIDFKCYIVASRCWQAGENLYDIKQMKQNGESRSDTTGTLFPYLYPPTLAILLTPLTKLHLWWASFIWHLISVSLTILAVPLGMRLCRAIVPPGATPNHVEFFLPAVAVGLLICLPFSMQFEWGQVNVLVLLFISLSLVWCYERKRDFSAGAWLACAAMIKFTPTYLLLYFLCQRRWKIAIGFIIGCIVLLIPMLAIPSGRIAWCQFCEFLPNTGYGKTIPGLMGPLGPGNFAVAGFWARLTTNPTLVAGLTYASLIILVLGVIGLHYRLRNKDSAKLLLLSHLVIMVVAAPYAYLHHVTFIYPGVLLTAYALWRLPEQRGKNTLNLLILSTLLASLFFPKLYSLAKLHYAFRAINLVGLIGLYFVGLWTAELCGRAERVPADKKAQSAALASTPSACR